MRKAISSGWEQLFGYEQVAKRIANIRLTIEYRYSGILVDLHNTHRGTVVTNSTFVSDFVQTKENAGSEGIPKTYTQYDKSGENPKRYNLKLIESQEVVHPQHLKLNWTGVIAYSVQVIDDKGEITEKSERPVNGVVT